MVERYGELTAHEYRHGCASPLGARYQRLLHEAKAADLGVLPPLEAMQTTEVVATAVGGRRGEH